jgi:hypothetical protein
VFAEKAQLIQEKISARTNKAYLNIDEDIYEATHPLSEWEQIERRLKAQIKRLSPQMFGVRSTLQTALEKVQSEILKQRTHN